MAINDVVRERVYRVWGILRVPLWSTTRVPTLARLTIFAYIAVLLRLPLFSPNLSVCRMIDGQQRAWRESSAKWCFWRGKDYNGLVHTECMFRRMLKTYLLTEDRGSLKLLLLERNATENGKLSVICFHCSSVTACCYILFIYSFIHSFIHLFVLIVHLKT